MAKRSKSTPKKAAAAKKAASPSPSKKEEASLLSELLCTPITEHVQELVGLPIRKCSGPRRWQNGVITALSNDTNNLCTVKYDEKAPESESDDDILTVQENIPINETLTKWIVAHAMYTLSTPENKNPALFKKRSPKIPYTLAELMKLLSYTAELHGGATMEDLEASKLIGKKRISKSCEVYGRMLPGAFDKILRVHLKLEKEHCFLDIGHGIGNTCIQAAYTVGCEARGLECDKGRNAVGELMTAQLEDAVDIHQKRDGMKFSPGNIKLVCGYLQDYQMHRNFMSTGVTRILFDNWNGVFNGERGDSNNLEKHVAAWFAMAPEGTVMCTVCPLRSSMGCVPLTEANMKREKQKLKPSSLASYYEVEEFDLGTLGQVYSFSEDSSSKEIIKCYRYVRTAQKGTAVFLCDNYLGCPDSKADVPIPIPALKIETNNEGIQVPVIGTCHCGYSARQLRRKRKTPS